MNHKALTYDAVVLAGGAGRRLGVIDKPGTIVGGKSMLDIVRAALTGAARTIVVGPGYDVNEQPPGGGPVAAIAAGLVFVTQPVVVVLAADLPFVTAAAVTALAKAAPAVAIDEDGREQWLLGAWVTSELHDSIPSDASGLGLGRTLGSLWFQRIMLPGSPPPWFDCDTPIDLHRARMLA